MHNSKARVVMSSSVRSDRTRTFEDMSVPSHLWATTTGKNLVLRDMLRMLPESENGCNCLPFQRRLQLFLLDGHGHVAARALQHAAHHVGGTPQSAGDRVGEFHGDEHAEDIF